MTNLYAMPDTLRLLCLFAAILAMAVQAMVIANFLAGRRLHKKAAFGAIAEFSVLLHIFVLAVTVYLVRMTVVENIVAETWLSYLRWSSALFALLCLLDFVVSLRGSSLVSALFMLPTLPYLEYVLDTTFYWMYGICVLVFLLRAIICGMEWRALYHQSANIDTLKEAIDMLPDGLLIANRRGKVLWANDQMKAICFDLLDLRPTNANLVWDAVSTLDEHNQKSLIENENSVLLFKNTRQGWRFTKQTFSVKRKTYIQIDATAPVRYDH